MQTLNLLVLICSLRPWLCHIIFHCLFCLSELIILVSLEVHVVSPKGQMLMII